jgi:hypothetical protein
MLRSVAVRCMQCRTLCPTAAVCVVVHVLRTSGNGAALWLNNSRAKVLTIV